MNIIEAKKVVLKGKHGEGKFTIVDEDDFESVSKDIWYLSAYGYAINGKGVTLHKFLLKYKPDSKKRVADHINGDRLDNRRCNLRVVTGQINTFRRKTKNKYRGVRWSESGKKWYASIIVNGKTIFLGRGKSKKEMARLWNEGAIKYFGDEALSVLNKV